MMKVLTALAVAAAAVLTGCQGGGSNVSTPPAPVAPQQRGAVPLSPINPTVRTGAPIALLPPAWYRPAPEALTANAYVSLFNYTYVNEYPAPNRKNAGPLCQIQNQPYVNGLAVDSAKNFWVPQGGVNSGTTTEFAPGCGKTLLAIPDSDGQPGAVAFDAGHNVYVENIIGASGPGSIDVYAPGATKPTKTLRDNSAFRWFDLAIDRSGNVFVAYADVYNLGHVIEFPHGKSSPLALQSLGFPGGVVLDSAGHLLVVDQDARNVSVYAAPFNGKPLATFGLKADSVPCRFNHRRTLLYCADYGNASIDIYKYSAADPGGTTYLYSFNKGIPKNSANAGIALAPAAPL